MYAATKQPVTGFILFIAPYISAWKVVGFKCPQSKHYYCYTLDEALNQNFRVLILLSDPLKNFAQNHFGQKHLLIMYNFSCRNSDIKGCYAVRGNWLLNGNQQAAADEGKTSLFFSPFITVL